MYAGTIDSKHKVCAYHNIVLSLFSFLFSLRNVVVLVRRYCTYCTVVYVPYRWNLVARGEASWQLAVGINHNGLTRPT